MTALTKAQIPNEIDSVEELHAWTSSILAYINPTKAIKEVAEENPQRVCEVFMLTADDGTERLISRVSIEIDKDWRGSTEQLHLLAKEFENVDIPTIFEATV